MPVEECSVTVHGEQRPGRRFGPEGKCYPCTRDGDGWDCSEARASAEAQGAAIEAEGSGTSLIAAGFQISTDQGPAFTSVLAYEGVITGDKRMVEPRGWSWPDPPLPFRIVMKDSGEHKDAQAVGVVESLERVPLAENPDLGTEDLIPTGKEPFAIVGKGHYDTSDLALEAARLAATKVKRGLSVDPSSGTATVALLTADGEVVDLDGLSPDQIQARSEEVLGSGGRDFTHVLEARIRGITQLDIAAFEDARVLEVEGTQLATKDDEGEGGGNDEDGEWTMFDLAAPGEPVVEEEEPAEEGEPAEEEDEDEQSTNTTNTTAAAVAPHSTGILPAGTDWDGNTAETKLPTGEEPGFYARFYAYMAEESRRSGAEQDGTAKDHWHYLHHVVEGSGSDATVGDASIEACIAIIQVLNGARGVNIVAKGEQRQAVYDHIARHLRDANYPDIPELKSEAQVQEAAMVSSSTPTLAPRDEAPSCEDFFTTDVNVTAAGITIPTVPAAHFDPDVLNPDMVASVGALPLTVTEEGRVFGHVARKDVCHVGMPGCVTMPESQSSLKYFHTGVVRLDDGADLSTGKLTIKGGHADIGHDWRKAMAHYDDVSTVFADVVAWEDDFGIAVTGHIRNGLSSEIIHAARGATPSGDWREIGNSPELINVHFVNSPGFPIYREESGRLKATVAASAAPVRFEGDSTVENADNFLNGDPSSVIAAAVSDALAIHELDKEFAAEVSDLPAKITLE